MTTIETLEINKKEKKIASYDIPHEKINRCLTNINRCLTDIFKIEPILTDI